MINLNQLFKDRPLFGRPLGLMSLMTVIATLFILTILLGAMVWGRVSLLQNGAQVVLKTAPVDPRDLLRGYFVRLSYDISRISPNELQQPLSLEEMRIGFKKHANIFVKLQPDENDFWAPISIHRTIPAKEIPDRSVFIRGRVQYGTCPGKRLIKRKCTYRIRYGIEKFFADKKRARKLEDIGRQQSPEIIELRKQIKELEKSYRRPWQKPDKAERLANKDLSAQLAPMRIRLSKLRDQNRSEMAKRFAVIVRIDKQSGEAAISGLQLDGKRIYEEPLF